MDKVDEVSAKNKVNNLEVVLIRLRLQNSLASRNVLFRNDNT